MALWPAGLAAIAAATIVAARRAPLAAAVDADEDLKSQGEPAPADAVGHDGGNAPAADAGRARKQADGRQADAAGLCRKHLAGCLASSGSVLSALRAGSAPTR